jgi:hypothetical protein
MEGIQDGEEIDGTVEEQEDDQEGAADALDELLADRGCQKVCHYDELIVFLGYQDTNINIFLG